MQQEGSLGRLLGPLLKTGLTSVENVLKPLDKGVLIPLVITAAVSATDAAIPKKIHCSGTTLIISNKEVENIVEIVKSLKESSLLIKGVIKTNENEAKEQKGGFLNILLDLLGAGISGKVLTGKGVIRAS